MALRRPPTTFSDEITAGDLAANSVTASELADDAVDTAALADGAVDADRLASNAVTTVKIANDAVDADKLASNSVVSANIVDANITAAKIAAEAIEVKPHIKLGLLYPAMKDTGGTVRLSDGVTAHSGNYGDAQSDGKSYYYTDIKGSRPIKDPRIGAHFGSQRHKFKSLQLLEQETATHGMGVFSIDGRENMRMASNGAVKMTNDSHGNFIYGRGDVGDHWYLEVVGYFSAVNMIHSTASSADRGFIYKIDGGSDSAEQTTFETSISTPLGSRYVDRGSLASVVTGQTLGIHTLRVRSYAASDYGLWYGVELIAQDTADATRKNHVNIPAQNVVSYGKKFSIGSDTLTNAVHKHYNPFAFKTDGTTAWASGANNGTSWPVGTGSSHNIDTTTSLGLENWKSGTDYYKPYNGGRVVKWVDSSGNIKTSVTVMPPNARSVGNSASLTNGTAKANASIANNTFYPTFEAGITDDFPTTALSEVAKTYNWREFGNGAANGGTSASGNKADASMLKDGVHDTIGWVMDDGLTSLSADTVEADSDQLTFRFNGNVSFYVTFIGTGISIEKKQYDSHAGGDSISYTLDGVVLKTYNSTNNAHPKFINLAQNLPYGTHVLKVSRAAVTNVHPYWKEFTFHQPKMPPIPDDAVVLADYMLMADFVAQGAVGTEKISKGVRTCSVSRDTFCNGPSGQSFNFALDVHHNLGFKIYQSTDANGTNYTFRNPSFCTNWVVRGLHPQAVTLYNGSSAGGSQTSGTNVVGSYRHLDSNLALGIQNSGWNPNASQNPTISGIDFVSPIHTSSHYQSFESPYLHELVGGDRNMEQTNLVVTADGKSWDEVTRDTSYIGSAIVTAKAPTNNTANDVIFDEWRGTTAISSNQTSDRYNKYFAIAYDRLICLKDGNYRIDFATYSDNNIAAGYDMYIWHNTQSAAQTWIDDANETGYHHISCSPYIKRGDYIKFRGAVREHLHNMTITKLDK